MLRRLKFTIYKEIFHFMVLKNCEFLMQSLKLDICIRHKFDFLSTQRKIVTERIWLKTLIEKRQCYFDFFFEC